MESGRHKRSEGIVMIIMPFASIATLTLVVGVMAMVLGLTEVVRAIRTRVEIGHLAPSTATQRRLCSTHVRTPSTDRRSRIDRTQRATALHSWRRRGGDLALRGAPHALAGAISDNRCIKVTTTAAVFAAAAIRAAAGQGRIALASWAPCSRCCGKGVR
ncbi:DUF308 domain-containing protein [Streptomyces triticisoli]|jgi:hypothetical protein|uniref:DUF308 domain-containing protein n=1 Tax=Streptomyces triticisoli TaxID=2182797 RepID=UPI003F69C050